MNRVTLLTLLVVVACHTSPRKPLNVPNDAVWAGGSDGGHWVSCGQTTKEPYAAFDCTFYSERGAVEASGHYVHATKQGERYIPVGAPFPSLRPEYFDGDVVGLARSEYLVPHGVVDHPFGDLHGKRQEYSFGRPAGQEVAY